LTLSLAAGAHAKPVSGLIRDIPSHRFAVHAAGGQANLPYNGGPVLHANRTHVIFWQPSGSGMGFDSGYQALVDTFLANVAAASHDPSNVYGLTGQYTDNFGPAAYASTWAGAVTDTDRLPSSGCVEPPVTGPGWTVCLTNSQLQSEIEHVVAADHLPTTADDVYFLVTPNGLGSCTDASSSSCALGGSVSGYCGYHSTTPDGAILYAVIPYNAVPGHCQSDNPRPNSSTADPALSTISHEHSEVVTDPVGDAWIDSSGSENGDRCITTFGQAIGGAGQSAWNEEIRGGHYFLQEEWSNDDHGCQPRDETAQLSFIFTPGGAGKPSRLQAHARDPDGTIASYLWEFADGTTGHGASVLHTFKRSGAYTVVLRTTDSAGNYAFYTRAISVAAARDRHRGPRRRKSRAPTKSG
jgi:hypothetical protein